MQIALKDHERNRKNYPWFMVKNANFAKSVQYKVDI